LLLSFEGASLGGFAFFHHPLPPGDHSFEVIVLVEDDEVRFQATGEAPFVAQACHSGRVQGKDGQDLFKVKAVLKQFLERFEEGDRLTDVHVDHVTLIIEDWKAARTIAAAGELFDG